MPGGQERQLCYLLQGMNRELYRPGIAVWSFRKTDAYVPWIQQLGIPLYKLPRRCLAVTKLRAFRELVGRLKPEVVHSYSFFTNFPAHWGARGTPAVVFGSMRGDFAREKRHNGPLLGRISACWPRNQIFNNLKAAESVRRSKSLFVPRDIYVVRNGLDLSRFGMTRLQEIGPIRIVGIGSLVPVKRWDRLLSAAVKLKRQGLDFLLQIAGDGVLHDTLERRAKALDVADRVTFLGHSNDIPDLLANATFLAQTSDSEGYPNVVMEAMACGRAVIATDVGDLGDLVEDGKTGFLVRRGDDAMLTERMVTLITNRDLCRRMGEAGRAKAEREFGLDRFVNETLDAYRAAGWKDRSI